MYKSSIIIIFCEECGEKNRVVSGNMSGRTIAIKCIRCKEELNIHSSSISKSARTGEEPQFISNLVLKYGDKILTVNNKRTCITMGRREDNDLVINDRHASRLHAFIEYRDGRYILSDQSTNGTCVFVKGRKGIILRKEEMIINSNGIIGLGIVVKYNSPEAIRFKIMV
ncbi:FHA domain-containing protein [Desulfococcaceae bacterium HSG9]|nr:FHA domain-containing protein [Desulfococcaceae bacterium HSG9]